jgi:hypothetical protein
MASPYKFSCFLACLSLETKDILFRYFNQNMHPSTEMLIQISKEAWIDVNQARKWFNVERQKYFSKTDIIKISRPNFDSNQKKLINDFFEKDMYPSSQMINSIASETKMSVKQVSICFQNKRNKLHSELSIKNKAVRKNTQFEFFQKIFLKEEFEKDANPTKKMKKIFAEKTNLSYKQVTIWFANNRNKYKSFNF